MIFYKEFGKSLLFFPIGNNNNWNEKYLVVIKDYQISARRLN